MKIEQMTINQRQFLMAALLELQDEENARLQKLAAEFDTINKNATLTHGQKSAALRMMGQSISENRQAAIYLDRIINRIIKTGEPQNK